MAVRYAALSACRKVRMPSVRAEKYIRDASGWRKDVTDGNDNGTDRRTDRVRRNMRPPPREEGRIKTDTVWQSALQSLPSRQFYRC